MGRATVGGLVAWASIRTLFENDYTLGNVTVATENDTYANVGGVFGQVNGILYNLYSAGVVTLKTSVEIHKAGSIAGDLAAASYADGCYYSGGSAFGKEGGKYNAETVADKSDIMGTQAFADILHNNLAPAAVEVMAANVATANVTGCGDFGAMTARVNDRFYDWTISTVRSCLTLHSGALPTSTQAFLPPATALRKIRIPSKRQSSSAHLQAP